MKNTKISRILVAILCIGLMPLSTIAQGFSYQLTMRQLLCNQTTELGEDEVYMIVNGQTSAGERWNLRLPNEHWDLNNTQEPRQVNDWILAQSARKLNIGESAVLNVVIMEEDDGRIGNEILNQGAKILSSCAASSPFCALGAGALAVGQALGIGRNTDDYIGSFTVILTRTQYGMQTQFSNYDRCRAVNVGINYPQGQLIQFIGDGSNYTGLFQFNFSEPW